MSFTNSSSALQEQVETNLVWKAEDVSHYMEEVFKRLFVEVESIADQAVCTRDEYRAAVYLLK